MAHTAKGRAVLQRVGRRVRALRVAAGYSQFELGRRANVGGRFVGLVERGVGNASLVTMVLIADALDVDLAELLTLEKPTPYVMLSKDDERRVRDAIATLRTVFPEHRRNQKRG